MGGGLSGLLLEFHPTHSSSGLVPSAFVLVLVVLRPPRPSGLGLPPLPAFGRNAESGLRRVGGGVFLAVLARMAKTAKNNSGRVAAFRGGAFSKAVF